MGSLSQMFDPTRDDFGIAMEAHIEKSDRTKLPRKELDESIAILVARLVDMNVLGMEAARLHG